MVSWDFLRGLIWGWITFLPVVAFGVFAAIIYTSVPIGDPDPSKALKAQLSERSAGGTESPSGTESDENPATTSSQTATGHDDAPHLPPPQQHRPRQGWIIVRRTFFEPPAETSYMNQMVRSFLDARSKDPKRTRPRDTFYAVLKGTVLFLYIDESQSDCWAAIEMSSYDVSIYYPSIDSGEAAGTGECIRMLDGELFAKRNAIVLRIRPDKEDDTAAGRSQMPPSLTKDMALGADRERDPDAPVESSDGEKSSESEETHSDDPAVDEKQRLEDAERDRAREEAFDTTRPWFLFVKSNVQMEDWYHAFIHASFNSPEIPVLQSLSSIFSPADLDMLVKTLDNQPDPIPMRWLNALIGRLFFSVYRTAKVEEFIISRLKRKLAKIKRPSYLSDVIVREASVGNTAPTLSRPMLKELTKEGEASVELGFHYKGEVRIIVEATATINLGARLKTYEVKLVLAVVLKEIEGNVLVRVKSPPSNRLWYAFTSAPKLELEVLPVVSDRQIKWSMILKPIESMLKDVVRVSHTPSC